LKLIVRPWQIILMTSLVLVGFVPPIATAAQSKSATPQASPQAARDNGPLPPAWLEFGPDGKLLARVIVDGDCPAIVIDGYSIPMVHRSQPTSSFPVVACESVVPYGVQTASILDQSLPVPRGPIQRIAVIGDTGCRLNFWEKKYQNCNDPVEWPFATVAATVAAWQPDLIVHVGDFLYRESPCPEDMSGCSGSPFGDNWQTWNADFFTPASSLLGVAPWLLMRGNHETCSRNAGGWFTYLDTRAFQSACQLFTEPYVAYLDGVTFAVLDSAEASDEVVHPGEEEEYQREFALLASLAPRGAWLTTHRPVSGLLEDQGGTYEVENASYEASAGDTLTGEYGLVLSGHIHLGEALTFDESSNRPPQLISGNSGTALDDAPEGSPSGAPFQTDVEEAETFSAFGFLTLEPGPDGWVATQREADGSSVLVCEVVSPQPICEPAQD